jgi:hypothetical protein
MLAIGFRFAQATGIRLRAAAIRAALLIRGKDVAYATREFYRTGS